MLMHISAEYQMLDFNTCCWPYNNNSNVTNSTPTAHLYAVVETLRFFSFGANA